MDNINIKEYSLLSRRGLQICHYFRHIRTQAVQCDTAVLGATVHTAFSIITFLYIILVTFFIILHVLLLLSIFYFYITCSYVSLIILIVMYVMFCVFCIIVLLCVLFVCKCVLYCCIVCTVCV
jgi:hypothetical protein